MTLVIQGTSHVWEIAVKLLSEKGLKNFSWQEWAQEAHVSYDFLKEHYPNRQSILEKIFQECQAFSWAAISQEELMNASPKERILELLMLRFEAFEKRRIMMEKLIQEALSFACEWRVLDQDVEDLLNQASLSPKGPIDMIKKMGILGIYVVGLKKWAHDHENTDGLMQFFDSTLTWGGKALSRYA